MTLDEPAAKRDLRDEEDEEVVMVCDQKLLGEGRAADGSLIS